MENGKTTPMKNERQTAETLLKSKCWAVVGANNNPEKYGNIIYKRLKAEGREVYAVNPMYGTVDGDTCYPDLASLPVVPDVIDMVVTPKRGYAVVDEAEKLGVRHIWFQPGTHDDDLLAYTEQKGLTALTACVLLAFNW
jgi:predicted CoA-binding protein